MIPYLSLLAFVTIVAYFGRLANHRLVRGVSLWVVGAVLLLFAGLRDLRIGADTATYVSLFWASDTIDILAERQDVGYFFLSWLTRLLSDSYAILLLLIAAIVVACHMVTIARVVERYETAIYLFITLGVYTFFFNGARQGIAAAVYFLAIPYLLQRRVWPYVALASVAFTFHRSALIALPLYWVATSRVTWRRVLALFGATGLLVAFLGLFVDIASTHLSDRFAAYGEAGEGGGEVLVAFLVGQGALLYYCKKVIPDSDRSYARLLNIYLIGLVPAVASTLSGVNPSGVLRLHMYFSPVAILMWPMIFRQFGMSPLRGILSVGFFAITLGFFVLTTTTFSGLSPYRFNSDIFPQ